MFEKYSLACRRAIFFARFEVSQIGGFAIEPEHLLLGLLRENFDLVQHLLSEHTSFHTLHEQVAGRVLTSGKVASSVDIPLSSEAKSILQRMEMEAQKDQKAQAEPKHMLLAIIGEEPSSAADVLKEQGVSDQKVRDY